MSPHPTLNTSSSSSSSLYSSTSGSSSSLCSESKVYPLHRIHAHLQIPVDPGRSLSLQVHPLPHPPHRPCYPDLRPRYPNPRPNPSSVSSPTQDAASPSYPPPSTSPPTPPSHCIKSRPTSLVVTPPPKRLLLVRFHRGGRVGRNVEVEVVKVVGPSVREARER